MTNKNKHIIIVGCEDEKIKIHEMLKNNVFMENILIMTPEEAKEKGLEYDNVRPPMKHDINNIVNMYDVKTLFKPPPSRKDKRKSNKMKKIKNKKL